MNTLKRSARVSYSARQMFEVVNNIEDYPRFLPWCQKADLISRTDTEVVASLEIAWKGIKKTFTTRNVLQPYNRVDITLVNGPMQHMEGIWQFIPLDEHACKVLLDLEFNMMGNFIDRMLQPVLQHIANTLVDAFCKRAVVLYGEN